MASGPFSYRDIQGTGPAWAINKGLSRSFALKEGHRIVKT